MTLVLPRGDAAVERGTWLCRQRLMRECPHAAAKSDSVDSVDIARLRRLHPAALFVMVVAAIARAEPIMRDQSNLLLCDDYGRRFAVLRMAEMLADSALERDGALEIRIEHGVPDGDDLVELRMEEGQKVEHRWQVKRQSTPLDRATRQIAIDSWPTDACLDRPQDGPSFRTTCGWARSRNRLHR